MIFHGKKGMHCYERIPSYSLTIFKDLMNTQTQVCVFRRELVWFLLVFIIRNLRVCVLRARATSVDAHVLVS